MLTSLGMNNKCHINLYILHSELDENDFEKIEESLSNFDIKIIPLKIDNSMLPPEAPTTEQWSLEIYYRLFLTEILPDSADRILYLDCDIIINKDISKLYNGDFDNNHLMVCKDVNGTRTKFTDTETLMFRDIYNDPTDYFNSGVLLINIAAMRKDGINFSKYFEVMKEYNFDLAMPDQDLLNFVHAGKIIHEDYEKYNMMPIAASKTNIDYDWAIENTCIYHFAEGKPWEIADHIHSKYETLWWNYAKKTPVYKALIKTYTESFDNRFFEAEKNIYNHELLFLKYINNYIILSKGIPEERLNALAEKYNHNDIVIKVLNAFDKYHNAKTSENKFSISKELKKYSDYFYSLSDDEKIKFVNGDANFNYYIKSNNEWLVNLAIATEALMYTVQELL